MKYKHIVWDWNGTLLDDMWLSVDAINYVLKSRGMPLVSNKDYRKVFCFPVIEYYKKLGFDFTKEQFPIPGFLEYYKKRFEDCHLHKNADIVIKKINQLGLTQSILSAGKQNKLITWVKYHNIDHFFSQLIGIDNDRADGKTESGINWLNNSSHKPENILLVGDTIHDSEVAKAMGVKCVLIDIGHVSSDRLKTTGAAVLTSLRSVLEYLQIE